MLPGAAYSVRVINGQLWCCCGYDGIVIFDAELWRQHTIPSKSMDVVWDVAQTPDCGVVIGACGGLWTCRVYVGGESLPCS